MKIIMSKCPVCKGIGLLPVRDIWPRLEALHRCLAVMGGEDDNESLIILESVMEVLKNE
jgi:hypothetical protein